MYQGSFCLPNLSENGAKRMKAMFRKRAKAIFIASCIDFLLECARQTPVLTGAARDAFLTRAEEAADELIAIAPTYAKQWGYMHVRNAVDTAHTLAKQGAGIYPVKGEGSLGRKEWRAELQAEGQGPGSFSSEAYVPMILRAGGRGSNQYVAKMVFHIDLQGWYLEEYNKGTVGPDYPIEAWELEKDGVIAFRKRFTELMHAKAGVTVKESTLDTMLDVVPF